MVFLWHKDYMIRAWDKLQNYRIRLIQNLITELEKRSKSWRVWRELPDILLSSKDPKEIC